MPGATAVLRLGFLLLAVVSAVSVALGASILDPAAASADTTMRAEAAVPILPAAGGYVPLEVTVVADRLIDGWLVLPGTDPRFGPGPGLVQIPVQVPGGSEKTFVLLAPTSSFGPMGGDGDRQFRIVLIDTDGNNVAERTVTVGSSPWTEAVGVLPDLHGQIRLPEDSALRVEAGDAAFHPLTPLVLEAGVDALDAYTTIVGSSGDLEALSPGARASVLSWVSQGGILLVDASAAPVRGLPDAWQPTEGWSFAGAGEIRLVDGAATSGDWDEILEPTSGEASIRSMRTGQAGSNGIDGAVSLNGSLASDAGFRLPDFRALLVGLAVYALLIGPIAFVVLARNRKRMAFWAVVPAGSLIATVVFVIVGTSFRSGADSAQTGVLEQSATGSWGQVTALVGSNRGGDVELRFPQGWVGTQDPMAGTETFRMGGTFSSSSSGTQRSVAVVPGGSASTARVELGPGEYQLVSASGPVDGAKGLDVRAEVVDGKARGTVRNDSGSALRAVVVLSGQRATLVGDLAAGEERSFDVGGAAAAMPEVALWDLSTEVISSNAEFGFGGVGMAISEPTIACLGDACGAGAEPLAVPFPKRTPEGETNPVNGAAWFSYLAGAGASLRTSDQVTAVGWTDGTASPLELGGGAAVDRGRIAMVTRTNVAPSGRLDTTGVRIDRVRGTDLRNIRRGDADLAVNGPLTRVVLPPLVDGRPLDPDSVAITLPGSVSEAQIWVGNGWRRVRRGGADQLSIRLSDDAVRRGVVYVRTGFAEEFAPPADPMFGSSAIAVTTDPPGDATIAVALTAEEIASKPAPFATEPS